MARRSLVVVGLAIVVVVGVAAAWHVWGADAWRRHAETERLLFELRHGTVEQRAHAARWLAAPVATDYWVCNPRPDDAIVALQIDPSPRVRESAASGLARYVADQYGDQATSLRVLGAVCMAATDDPSGDVRVIAFFSLGDVVWKQQYGEDEGFRRRASRLVKEAATKGLHDKDTLASEYAGDLLPQSDGRAVARPKP